MASDKQRPEAQPQQESQALIEQAKRVLMEARGCSDEAAMGILVRLSEHSHRDLQDVAQAVVVDAATANDSK